MIMNCKDGILKAGLITVLVLLIAVGIASADVTVTDYQETVVTPGETYWAYNFTFDKTAKLGSTPSGTLLWFNVRFKS